MSNLSYYHSKIQTKIIKIVSIFFRCNQVQIIIIKSHFHNIFQKFQYQTKFFGKESYNRLLTRLRVSVHMHVFNI
ncbi:unnamed protein product [Paramecium octaurelia]|uniref:Uncharacterized protein n=1 Tax=Paramecium octaurelia TaxID=43137 RepID=A0A8S1T313_PAROT|nr:unnamed protein product [Paramecium octaurelia]